MLAPVLAQSFAQTGVWPLLWDFPDDPDSYMGGHGILDAIDSVDLPAVLTEHWLSHTIGKTSDPPTWDLLGGSAEQRLPQSPTSHQQSRSPRGSC